MECNPFHEGHRYIIEKARKAAGEDGRVVVVMSGNFVQRGIPAVRSKEVRARQVLEAGADLVLELPVRYATGAAGYFAEGAVATLAATGIVTDLVFGSECADAGALERCAQLLFDEPEDYRELLRGYLSQGLSYPLARARAAAESADAVTLPESPNDLLGVEYLRALRMLSAEHASPRMLAHAIPRIAAVSATSLREELQASDDGIFADDFSGMLLEKLLMIQYGSCRSAMSDYAGVAPDLANRIGNLLPQYTSWTQFCSLLKTRNITRTAAGRALTHILLDVTDDLMPEGTVSEDITYARVLGCRRDALALIGMIRDHGLRLITSRSDARRFLPDDSRAQRQMKQDLHASEIWEHLAAVKAAYAYQKTAGAPLSAPAVPEFSKPLLIVE